MSTSVDLGIRWIRFSLTEDPSSAGLQRSHHKGMRQCCTVRWQQAVTLIARSSGARALAHFDRHGRARVRPADYRKSTEQTLNICCMWADRDHLSELSTTQTHRGTMHVISLRGTRILVLGVALSQRMCLICTVHAPGLCRRVYEYLPFRNCLSQQFLKIGRIRQFPGLQLDWGSTSTRNGSPGCAQTRVREEGRN